MREDFVSLTEDINVSILKNFYVTFYEYNFVQILSINNFFMDQILFFYTIKTW